MREKSERRRDGRRAELARMLADWSVLALAEGAISEAGLEEAVNDLALIGRLAGIEAARRLGQFLIDERGPGMAVDERGARALRSVFRYYAGRLNSDDSVLDCCAEVEVLYDFINSSTEPGGPSEARCLEMILSFRAALQRPPPAWREGWR